MDDGFEVNNGLNPLTDDSAGDLEPDGATNLQEFQAGSDPNDPDTDADLLTDGEELNVYGTDPTVVDTDGDGQNDGDEVNGTNNVAFGNEPTDPTVADSDGDDYNDGLEIDNMTNPNDDTSFPPIDPGLIAYFPLDGNLCDFSVTAADGTFVGTAAEAYADTGGVEDSTVGTLDASFNQGILLDGVDQRVVLDGTASSIYNPETGDVSISAWFKANALSATWQALVAKGEGSAWRIARRGNSNVLGYAGGVGDIPPNDTTGPMINDNLMHHVVAITEGGVSTRLWVDGGLVATGGVPTLEQGDNAAPMIGGNPDAGSSGTPNRNWNGIIDDVGIWDRVLSESEIQALWNGGIGRTIATLAPSIDLDNKPADGLPVTTAVVYNEATTTFSMTVANLSPSTTYELYISTDGINFTPVAGSSMTGAASTTFTDTASPGGVVVLYQVRVVPL